MSNKSSWIDITQDLTPKGIEELQVGNILIFNFEGSRNELRIVRKRHGKVWAKKVTTYSPAEADQMARDAQKAFGEN